MSVFIDKKFINLASPTLFNFKWKKEDLANCRCPFCGDSQKSKTKARGYFYQRGNNFSYKCHNCGHGCSIYNFLKEVSPSLCKEYSLDKWKEKGGNKTQEDVEVFKFIDKKPEFKKNDKLLDGLDRLCDLPDDHISVQFANMRILPKQHWKILYYTDDFGSFMQRLDPKCLPAGKEERLIIPFFNKDGDVVAAQGRALSMSREVSARETIKYITVKYDKSIDRLWYGLWRANPKKRVYVVEGPLDSLFLQNSVAMVGAGALKEIPKRFVNTPMTYILDNEPRNRQICSYIEKLIELGREVCIFPNDIKEKDINDMAYRLSTRKIQKMIDENTFSGLEATLKFRDWRKV